MIVEQSMRSTLESGMSGPIEIYSEYLDAVRTPLDGHAKELVGQLRRKYAAKNFDLICAVNPPALKLLLENRSAFFPNTPVVFLVLDEQNVSGLDSAPNMTGVWGEVSYKSNLELALALHPGTKRVVVISGVGEWDNYWRSLVREELHALEGRIEFSYLTGLTISELKKELAALPPQSLVLFVSSTQDHEGNNPGNLTVLREICPASSAPVYGSSDAQLGLGIVGGKLLSFEALGAEGARVGLRVIAGEKPEAIAPHGIPSVPIFDWRQLQRWGISEASLPEGSIIQYKQLTVWEEYKWYVIGLLTAIVVETTLIVWLLYLRLRRRQAETEAARLGGRLAEIVSNVPGIVWESRAVPGTNRRTTTFISGYVQKMLGYSPEEWLKEPPGFGAQIIPEEDRERVLRESDEVIESGQNAVSEFRWLTKDGRIRWVENYLSPIVDEEAGIVGLRGVALDVTERYSAQKAVQESEARFRNLAETAPVMIWVSDENQATTYVNNKWLELTGATFEQELGSAWLRHVHPDDLDPTGEKFAAAFEGRVPFELEFRVRRSDGEYRWVLSAGSPLFSAGGEFVGFIGTSIDISDRMQSERELKQAHAELSELKDQLEAENIYLQEELRKDHVYGDMVGESSAIKDLLVKISQVAPTDSTVLITGETGTGKELVARAIHETSQRKDRPLIKLNCAALSPTLIESELFGHEKGAFTGADARRLGRFELANTGTLLLDEIGELPPGLQGNLLRVLQDGEFERVGGTRTIKVDVRVIASTNRDLKQAVKNGTFRGDLWYRLNIFPIESPPLRERPDDIPLLVEHFAAIFGRKLGKHVTAVSPEGMKALCKYSWPGNVRELANVIESSVINMRGNVLRVHEDFATRVATASADSLKTLEDLEREHILRALEDLNWRVDGPKGVARVLGINPSTLRTRMGKLGINKPNARPAAE